jgi:hypothetical protein
MTTEFLKVSPDEDFGPKLNRTPPEKLVLLSVTFPQAPPMRVYFLIAVRFSSLNHLYLPIY